MCALTCTTDHADAPKTANVRAITGADSSTADRVKHDTSLHNAQ